MNESITEPTVYRLPLMRAVLNETIATAVLTMPLFVAIAVARAGAPNTYVPACDEFRGRLETANLTRPGNDRGHRHGCQKVDLGESDGL